MRTVNDVINQLYFPQVSELPAPEYCPFEPGSRIALAVEAMKRHTADAGWQIMDGLKHAGYLLCGSDLTINEQDVPKIIRATNPEVVVIQDKREWEGRTARQRGNPRLKFHNVEYLKSRNDIFKLTVLKDSHQNPLYHKNSADEMGVHCWIIYYHPKIVKHVAPYVRLEHCVRTSHSIDSTKVPEFSSDRKGCLVSGAVSVHYPLRLRIIRNYRLLPGTEYIKHPGYQSRRCVTPNFLKRLSQYKVSICTSSRYGYALRKLIESSACGCIVITDLPEDDKLPVIEENLVRIPSDIPIRELGNLIKRLSESYDEEKQKRIAESIKEYYDFKAVGARLSSNIEKLRSQYGEEL